MGEVLVMLRSMFYDSIAVLAYMILLAVVAGIAYSVALPPQVMIFEPAQMLHPRINHKNP
jgi:hypothetical protein